MLAAAGCSFGDSEESTSLPRLASGEPLPDRCVVQRVRRRATVTFVANGRAWALDPDTGRPSCLFPAREPGPFAWGPRGDRVLLASLEVKGLRGAPTRPPTTIDPPAASWGRPIGKSIVFVGRRGRVLLKAHPAGGGFTDVTPMKQLRYRRVVYHPSGLAFAFIPRSADGIESIWISTNTGNWPRMLVHGRAHTGFGLLAFGDGGTALYFSARHADDRDDVHSLPLADPRFAEVRWRGEPGERVSDLFVTDGGQIALTAGRDCESRRALRVGPLPRRAVATLVEEQPSRALGWLDGEHVLVGVGGCRRPLDLYTVDTSSLASRLLVRGVSAASVRRAEPLPPPSLPIKLGPRGKQAAVA